MTTEHGPSLETQNNKHVQRNMGGTCMTKHGPQLETKKSTRQKALLSAEVLVGSTAGSSSTPSPSLALAGVQGVWDPRSQVATQAETISAYLGESLVPQLRVSKFERKSHESLIRVLGLLGISQRASPISSLFRPKSTPISAAAPHSNHIRLWHVRTSCTTHLSGLAPKGPKQSKSRDSGSETS